MSAWACAFLAPIQRHTVRQTSSRRSRKSHWRGKAPSERSSDSWLPAPFFYKLVFRGN